MNSRESDAYGDTPPASQDYINEDDNQEGIVGNIKRAIGGLTGRKSDLREDTDRDHDGGAREDDTFGDDSTYDATADMATGYQNRSQDTGISVADGDITPGSTGTTNYVAGESESIDSDMGVADYAGGDVDDSTDRNRL